MMLDRFSPFSRFFAAAALAATLASCGGGDIVFPGDDDDDDDDATVTIMGNVDDVFPVTTRDIVAFAFSIDDGSTRCDCPVDPGDCNTQGRAAVMESGTTTFTLSGLDAGPVGVVFLLDNPGDAADGQIDVGDPIAVLDDVDCELDDVEGNITVTLKDVDLFFDDKAAPLPGTVCPFDDPLPECRVDQPPAAGRARADLITQARTSTSQN